MESPGSGYFEFLLATLSGPSALAVGTALDAPKRSYSRVGKWQRQGKRTSRPASVGRILKPVSWNGLGICCAVS